MSLNPEQRAGTARELQRNLELSELTLPELAATLDITPERLQRALEVGDDADPADVWMLRDLLEAAVRRTGRIPERYSVLDESARASAARWFGLPVRPGRPPR